MRQTYHKPTLRHCLVSSSQLLSESMQVSNEKVENASDIGFTKKDDGNRYNVWNDDWRE